MIFLPYLIVSPLTSTSTSLSCTICFPNVSFNTISIVALVSAFTSVFGIVTSAISLLTTFTVFVWCCTAYCGSTNLATSVNGLDFTSSDSCIVADARPFVTFIGSVIFTPLIL